MPSQGQEHVVISKVGRVKGDAATKNRQIAGREGLREFNNSSIYLPNEFTYQISPYMVNPRVSLNTHSRMVHENQSSLASKQNVSEPPYEGIFLD